MADGKVVKSLVNGIKSLYYDPFHWQVVKSVGLFALGVYIAKEVAKIDLEAVTQ